jgi:uncharacterized membrane protein YtjA (UPF0391 family)
MTCDGTPQALKEAVTKPSTGETTMLRWALTFLIIAIIAAVFGFSGIAGTATQIAQILFFVFLVLLIISAVMGAFRGRPPE